MIERFTSDNFPNTHISFDQNGLKLTITLNIPKSIVKLMPRNKVFKSNKFWTYYVADYVQEPTIGKMKDKYNTLMQKAMLNIREAKIEKIRQEQNRIINQQILF